MDTASFKNSRIQVRYLLYPYERYGTVAAKLLVLTIKKNKVGTGTGYPTTTKNLISLCGCKKMYFL